MRKETTIAVIGLGFVGLPLSQLLVKKGYRVIGIDIDVRKIEQIDAKKSFLSDLSDEDIGSMVESGRFTATSDYARLKEANCIIICVPTPLRNKEPDLSYVFSAVQNMTPHLRPGQLIILESSTFPGTTEEYVRPMLESGPLKIGETLFLGYSPERIDPGNKEVDLEKIPKIVSGVTEACLKRVQRLYGNVFEKVVPVSSPRVAEFAKMLENSQRLINISFINEVNLLANKMNVNLWEVIEAAKTKPIGFTPYYPSAGIGGHCIPVDPFFLSWIGMREGVPLTMIHNAGFVNEVIPHSIVNRVVRELSIRNIKPHQAKVGVIGLTYKKNVNDIRESAAVKVVALMLQRRMKVAVYEPVYNGELPFGLQRFEATQKELGSFDLVLVLVDHSSVPWEDIARYSHCVIDTRNVIPDIAGKQIVRM